ncbi:MAG TPA: hypothetical protein VLL25_18880, partial [Acidimicrobiales bacterium]|nr:hypothetical protein [Acidimicrobiales bacterium]
MPSTIREGAPIPRGFAASPPSDEDAWIMVGKGDVDDLFDVVAGSDPDDENVEILLRVRVQPGAGRTAVIGRYGHGP